MAPQVVHTKKGLFLFLTSTKE